MKVERAPYDPERATVVTLNGCDICEANLGGFEETHYFDADGKEVLQT